MLTGGECSSVAKARTPMGAARWTTSLLAARSIAIESIRLAGHGGLPSCWRSARGGGRGGGFVPVGRGRQKLFISRHPSRPFRHGRADVSAQALEPQRPGATAPGSPRRPRRNKPPGNEHHQPRSTQTRLPAPVASKSSHVAVLLFSVPAPPTSVLRLLSVLPQSQANPRRSLALPPVLAPGDFEGERAGVRGKEVNATHLLFLPPPSCCNRREDTHTCSHALANRRTSPTLKHDMLGKLQSVLRMRRQGLHPSYLLSSSLPSSLSFSLSF
jgi:hypothetical protein